MSTVIQIRRGPEEEANSFIGYEGELFIDLDNKTLRYHDGIKKGGHIIGAVTLEGISKISSINYLNSIHVLDDQISIMGHMRPTADVVYDLGSADYRFKDLYLGGQTINISGIQIYVDNNGDLIVPGYATQTYADDVATATVDLEVIARDAAILAAITTEIADRNTAISDAIATEVTDRNTAISDAIATEVTDRDNAISTAVSDAISTEVTDRNTAISDAIATEVTDRNTAISDSISTAIATEVTDRNTAIASAISTEVTNRDSAIATAVANIIDTAPATLDTLNELAAALGDDANFATNVSTNIGNVQSELDVTQVGAGLNVDGTYTANTSSNYISTAASLTDADNMLDTELKAVDTAYKAADVILQNNIDSEETRALTIEGVLQDNIDAEAATRLADDTALADRLDIIEGTGAGSITKAVADTAVLKADLAGASFTGDISLGGNDLNDVSNINSIATLNIDAGGSVIIDSHTTVNGTVTAVNFDGDGSNITNIEWAHINNTPAGTHQTFVATANQTTFNYTYNIGAIDVFRNGIKLVENVEFTANDGTTVVLNTPATLGDYIELVANEAAIATLIDLNGYATEAWVNSFNYQSDVQVAVTVQNVVNNMLDGAPAALDTLNELAAALGNDPNFATTVTNELATKANAADVYTSTDVDTLLANLEAYDQSLNTTDIVIFREVGVLDSTRTIGSDGHRSKIVGLDQNSELWSIGTSSGGGASELNISSTYPAVPITFSIGGPVLASLDSSGTFAATSFVGDGSGLTNVYDQSLHKSDNVEFASATIQSVMNLTPQMVEPPYPTEGTIAVADGGMWDPEGSGTAGTQPVIYSNGSWKSLILQVYDVNGNLL